MVSAKALFYARRCGRFVNRPYGFCFRADENRRADDTILPEFGEIAGMTIGCRGDLRSPAVQALSPCTIRRRSAADRRYPARATKGRPYRSLSMRRRNCGRMISAPTAVRMNQRRSATTSQSLAEFAQGAKKSNPFFRRHVVRMGLLHAAAALRRDGSVSAPPFFLSKSKPML